MAHIAPMGKKLFASMCKIVQLESGNCGIDPLWGEAKGVFQLAGVKPSYIIRSRQRILQRFAPHAMEGNCAYKQ